jgi:MoxR-like ATPase
MRALVASPLFVAMRDGVLLRFEEVTRCPPEIQDVLVSVLSDKVMLIPELDGPDRVLLAKPGFNVIATANLRDRGVHEMSSALKRRFNFETVHPIRELDLEIKLVTEECERLLKDAGAPIEVDRDVIGLLVAAFQDLREGKTAEGVPVDRPTSVMSTAEAVSVAMSAGLDAFYYAKDGQRQLTPRHIARHLAGAVLKDNPDDLKKLKQYFDVVIRKRGETQGGLWAELFQAKKALP